MFAAREFPPLRRIIKRLPFIVTLEGIGWLLLAILLLSQGWLRNFNLVTLIGSIMLGLWCLNLLWILMWARLDSLEVARRFSEPIFASTSFTLSYEIRNRSIWRHWGALIEDPGVEMVYRSFVGFLAPGERRIVNHQAIFTNRGLCSWPSLKLSTGFPFGLARRVSMISAAEESIILPALGRLQKEKVRRLLRMMAKDMEWNRAEARPQVTAQEEFHGLREYRSGDNVKSIHWRTTARIGDLMVREFEDTPHENLIIVLNPIGNFGDESLELAISLAATVSWEWCKQTGAILSLAILGEHELLTLETGPRRSLPFLEKLALAKGIGPQQSVAAKLISANGLPSGAVLVISSQPTGLDRELSKQLARPVAKIDTSVDDLSDFFNT